MQSADGDGRMVAGILSRWRVWLAVASVVASLLVGGCFGEGISDEVTGTSMPREDIPDEVTGTSMPREDIPDEVTGTSMPREDIPDEVTGTSMPREDISTQITGTLVFECDEAQTVIQNIDTCRETLPDDGWIELVDVTGIQLDDAYHIFVLDVPEVSYEVVPENDLLFVRIPESRIVGEGVIEGTDRASPVPFSIDFDPQTIDPEADYVILAYFLYDEWKEYSSWGADYRNTFDSEGSPTPVLTKGHPSKDVAVPLKVLGRVSWTN